MEQEPDEIRYVNGIFGEKIALKHFKEYQIGKVILKDLWITGKGVIQKTIKVDKRTHRVLHWISCRNMTLRQLMYIVSFLNRHNLKVYQIGRLVMIEIIMQLLKCSKRTAIDYLASLWYIAEQLGVY